jgi:DNA-binding MarR family transcriptional regulator
MNRNESSNEPLPGLAVYNPALLKKEDLIAQFVARQPLLNRLVEELRRCGGKGDCQHQLIVGPRGTGKTTLLRRLRYAIEDDADLSSRWVPLVFPEEQYNVSRLSDLWANCLDALGDALERLGRRDDADWLDEQIDKLPADDEKRRAQAALDLLIGWAKKEDHGLVLLLDNSDLIFDRLKADHWAIREVLSGDNHLLFIGATSAPIEATYNHEGAFYDFFKIHELRGLTGQETREVITNLARLRNTPHVIETLEREPGRIRTLNLLTGGNLRTIVVLYQALARGKDDSIRADLEQLLDQYTPLYKHRFEALSAQSQQVVDALALNWDPTTAANLAEKLRLETNAVSAVLNRLESDGVVEKAQSPPGEKMFFQIAERFFNIWYLMRASRRVRRKLIWLVEFLKMFYGAAELRPRARHLAQEPGKWDEAVVFARKFIVEGDDEYHEKVWPDIIAFFRDAVATGHTEEAMALLDETEYDERWRPLREALQAIAEDDSSYLLRVAPEVRQPAEEIVALLLPEGVRLGSAPKAARARRTRPKRSLS